MRLDDVGDDPQAAGTTVDDAERLPALEAQGFRRLTLVRAWAVDRKSFVSTLLRSGDGTAFGESERLGSLRVTLVRTVLEDGTLIETSLVSPSLKTLLFGPLRVHHPRAGFHAARVRRIEDLWTSHRDRVARVAAQEQTTIPRHDSLELYRDVTARGMEIAFFQSQAILVLPFLAIFAAMLPAVLTGQDEFDKPLLYGSIAVGVMLGRLFGRHVMAMLPWPRRRRP